MRRQYGYVRVGVVPTDHPSRLADGGRHFVRVKVKAPQKIQHQVSPYNTKQ
jgi:hypothetical protein